MSPTSNDYHGSARDMAIHQSQREENWNQMKADWNLHDRWQSLQEQVEEGQLFAALANAAISDVDAVDIAVSVLMKTCMFEHAYKE